jgi:hypothetical protein
MTALHIPLPCDLCGRRWTYRLLCKVCQDIADAVAKQNQEQDRTRKMRMAAS